MLTVVIVSEETNMISISWLYLANHSKDWLESFFAMNLSFRNVAWLKIKIKTKQKWIMSYIHFRDDKNWHDLMLENLQHSSLIFWMMQNDGSKALDLPIMQHLYIKTKVTNEEIITCLSPTCYFGVLYLFPFALYAILCYLIWHLIFTEVPFIG